MPEDDFDEFGDEEIPEHILAGVAQVPRTAANPPHGKPAPSSNEFDEFCDDDLLGGEALDMLEASARHKRAKTEIQNQTPASASTASKVFF